MSSVIGFFAAHGEKLNLGALLASASFGVFSIASLLLAAVVGVYGSLNGHVVFARLSEVARRSRSELDQVYARVQRIADCALGLLADTLAMAGHWIVVVLYDARYEGAGWMLQGLGLGLVALARRSRLAGRTGRGAAARCRHRRGPTANGVEAAPCEKVLPAREQSWAHGKQLAGVKPDAMAEPPSERQARRRHG